MASGTIKAVVGRSDIVNNLTTNDSTKVLSAAQGKTLNSKIGDIFAYASINNSGNASSKFAEAFTAIIGTGKYVADKTYPVMLVFLGGGLTGTFTGTFNVTSGGIRFFVSDEVNMFQGLFLRSNNTISSLTNLNNKIGILPNPTEISSLDGLKIHLLSIHNSLANNGMQTSHIDILAGYTGGYFVNSSRYAGVYKRLTANQGVIEYSSPNKADTVTVGLYSVSTSPTLNVFSTYSNIAKQSVTVTPTSALKSNTGRLFGYKTGNIVVITCINVQLDSAISSDTAIATLAVAPNEQYFANCISVDGNLYLAFVKTDGKLYLSGLNSPPANRQIYLSLSYVSE